jgi:spore maturation protein CgeB
MRGLQIADYYKDSSFQVINIHIPFYKSHRVFRSIGVRFKLGPLIPRINKFIQSNLQEDYDLIWVDKGVFIKKETLLQLRKKSKKLVHYTPDMAFYANKTSNFIDHMDVYDFLITTKSAEISFYAEQVNKDKIILTKQGFDLNTHKPYNTFEEKEDYISFIGLFEESRGELIQQIIDVNIPVKVAGYRWEKFALKNKNNKNFTLIGKGLYSEDYSKFISKSIMSLGLLSKNFPEKHTTRTFEIPACGTALITEKNTETSTFYSEDEVLFFNSQKELITKISFYFENKQKLKKLSISGRENVIKNGCDYASIIKQLLKDINVN